MSFITLIVPNFVTFTNILNASQKNYLYKFQKYPGFFPDIPRWNGQYCLHLIFQFCCSLMKNKIRTITMFASSPRWIFSDSLTIDEEEPSNISPNKHRRVKTTNTFPPQRIMLEFRINKFQCSAHFRWFLWWLGDVLYTQSDQEVFSISRSPQHLEHLSFLAMGS